MTTTDFALPCSMFPFKYRRLIASISIQPPPCILWHPSTDCHDRSPYHQVPRNMQLSGRCLGRAQGIHDAPAQRKRYLVMRAAQGRQNAPLPQAQILEAAMAASERRQSPSAPMKVEQTAQFLKSELRGLFETGVSFGGEAGRACTCRRCISIALEDWYHDATNHGSLIFCGLKLIYLHMHIPVAWGPHAAYVVLTAASIDCSHMPPITQDFGPGP